MGNDHATTAVATAENDVSRIVDVDDATSRTGDVIHVYRRNHITGQLVELLPEQDYELMYYNNGEEDEKGKAAIGEQSTLEDDHEISNNDDKRMEEIQLARNKSRQRTITHLSARI